MLLFTVNRAPSSAGEGNSNVCGVWDPVRLAAVQRSGPEELALLLELGIRGMLALARKGEVSNQRNLHFSHPPSVLPAVRMNALGMEQCNSLLPESDISSCHITKKQ